MVENLFSNLPIQIPLQRHGHSGPLKSSAHVQEGLKQLVNHPKATPILKHTQLPPSETLRPCARSNGAENVLPTCQNRVPCTGPSYLDSTISEPVREDFNNFATVPRLGQCFEALDCQLLKHSDSVPAAMGSRIKTLSSKRDVAKTWPFWATFSPRKPCKRNFNRF
jgi:hypothetical protein